MRYCYDFHCKTLRISYDESLFSNVSSPDDNLKAAEETAKAEGKGMHATDAHQRVRQVVWECENPRQLVDRMQGKKISALIENVRDGSTVRAFLLPDFYHITLMMSGVKVNVK